MKNRLVTSVQALAGITAAGVVATAAYAALVRPWHLRWGATRDEVWRGWPGDELIPAPRLTATHAVTIQAPVDAVWPWLAQLGQGRGGFYSYTWIEDMLGAGIRNAHEILPQFQHPQVGDKVPLAANGLGLPIALLEPGRTLVLHGDTRLAQPEDPEILRPRNYLSISWGFYLQPHEAGTRLIERCRMDWNPSTENEVKMRAFLEPGAFVMERAMLLGIKARAEALAAEPQAAPLP